MSKDMELRVLNAKKNVKDLNCIFGGKYVVTASVAKKNMISS